MKTSLLILTAFSLLPFSTTHAAQKKLANTDLCSQFTIISHRGLSGLFPEESKPAYLAAADLGTDYLEMDVHRTKDNILIVNHDNSFARTTNISSIFPERVNDLISTFTFDEISKLSNKGVPILKLEDVINIAILHPLHPGLYIESKSPELYPGVEKQMIDLLESKGAFKTVKVYFQSFDLESIKRFKELRPEIPRLYLTDAPYSTLTKVEIPLAVQYANGIGPNLGVIKSNKLDAFLSLVHQSKLIVHFWTVDDQNLMKVLINAHADGIFTNRTDLLVEACGRLNKPEITKMLSRY